MEPEVAAKPADELGEEDLVDYEEEEETAQTEKPTENTKEGTKKYARHSFPPKHALPCPPPIPLSDNAANETPTVNW